MLNHSGILKQAFAIADEKTNKVSIGEHMIRTQMNMNNIMEMSLDVLPKLADTLSKYKLRKAMQKLSEPIIKEETDWNGGTEQGLGTSNL